MPHGAQVLVIDDDRQILRLFGRILVDGGVSVLVADSGKKGLELLGTHKVKVVVLDINMPNPDGFELLNVIRSEAHRPRVLAVSGFADGALLGAAGFLGADATLNKSDAPDMLLASVKNLMEREGSSVSCKSRTKRKEDGFGDRIPGCDQ